MLTALIGPVSKLVGKFIEDKDTKNKLSHDLATLASRHAQELAKGQIEANTAQAKHPSLFVAGARPAIMWICALGLLTQFFLLRGRLNPKSCERKLKMFLVLGRGVFQKFQPMPFFLQNQKC